MKSTVPTGTIEVSAHIQIAIDKERRDQTKKKETILRRVHFSWHHVGPYGGGETDISAFLLCFQCGRLFLTSDDPTTMYSINIV